MAKYIKLKRHKRVVALYESQLHQLRTIVATQRAQINKHELELRREVANARHGTLQDHVQKLRESKIEGGFIIDPGTGRELWS